VRREAQLLPDRAGVPPDAARLGRGELRVQRRQAAAGRLHDARRQRPDERERQQQVADDDAGAVRQRGVTDGPVLSLELHLPPGRQRLFRLQPDQAADRACPRSAKPRGDAEGDVRVGFLKSGNRVIGVIGLWYRTRQSPNSMTQSINLTIKLPDYPITRLPDSWLLFVFAARNDCEI